MSHPTTDHTGLGYDMATNNGSSNHSQQKQGRFSNIFEEEFNSDKTGVQNPVPILKFQQSKLGALGFWLQYGNSKRITHSVQEFSQFTLQQQANLIFLQQFYTSHDVLLYMHTAIRNKMIWTPNCAAMDNHNQFHPTFVTYCANWMKIIYQLLWYVKDIDINSGIIQSLEAAALAKLNQLHANRKYDCKIKNFNWDNDSLILQPFEEKTDVNGNAMDITLQSYIQKGSSDESDSKDNNIKNEFWFANESRKEKENKS